VLSLLDAHGARDAFVTPPLTTDHLIRTKSLPLWIDQPAWGDEAALRSQVAAGIDAYRKGYGEYVERHLAEMPSGLGAVDPTPRVVLVPGLGAICAGRTAREAAITRDITARTLEVKSRIAAMGTYEGLGECDLFLMEYRGVQHAKLAASAGALHDRVAVVTGAAGAIGTGVAIGLLEAGCHVIVTDLAGAPLESLAAELDAAFPGRAVGVPMDVTEAASVAEAFRFAAEHRDRYAAFVEADGSLRGPGFSQAEAAAFPEHLRGAVGIVVSAGSAPGPGSGPEPGSAAGPGSVPRSPSA